jgi:Fe-S-cluster containining protein
MSLFDDGFGGTGAVRSKLIPATDLLRAVYETTASLSGHVRAKVSAEIGPVTCKQGCSFCCYQKVLVTAAAGTLIYLHLKQAKMWGPEMIAYLSKTDRIMTSHSHEEYAAKRLPCPFLRESGVLGRGECGIYQARPFTCATTVSVTTDPAKCLSTGDTADAQIWLVSPDVERLGAAIAEESLGDRGLVDLLCTLPGSVLVGAALYEKRGLPREIWVVDRRTIPPTLAGGAFTAYVDARAKDFVGTPARALE